MNTPASKLLRLVLSNVVVEKDHAAVLTLVVIFLTIPRRIRDSASRTASGVIKPPILFSHSLRRIPWLNQLERVRDKDARAFENQPSATDTSIHRHTLADFNPCHRDISSQTRVYLRGMKSNSPELSIRVYPTKELTIKL